MYVLRVAYGGQRITLGPQLPPCLEQGLLLVTAKYTRLAGPGASGILLSPLTPWHIRHRLCRHTLPHQLHREDTHCHTRHTTQTHTAAPGTPCRHHGAGDSNSSLHVGIKLFIYRAVTPALNQDIFRFPRCDSFTPDKFL